ncbi:MAG: OmpH family outer membrane protein [Bacteroidales bacterium]|nr:OmpH family outer membrane protein [Candidatus Liminaster caballi]
MHRISLTLVMVLTSVWAMAQDLNVGILDIKSVFRALPESVQIQTQIDFLQGAYQTELSKLEDEYQSKVSNYLTDRDRLPQNIQDARIQEIDQLQLRIQAMRREAAADLAKKQDALTEPLRARVNDAIRQVSEEKGLIYVLDSGSDALLYASPTHVINIYDDVLSLLTSKN